MVGMGIMIIYYTKIPGKLNVLTINYVEIVGNKYDHNRGNVNIYIYIYIYILNELCLYTYINETQHTMFL